MLLLVPSCLCPTLHQPVVTQPVGGREWLIDGSVSLVGLSGTDLDLDESVPSGWLTVTTADQAL